MEIAVADMADERYREGRVARVGLGFQDALGQAGNGHAHVRRPALRARPQGDGGVEGVVPRLPEAVALLRRGGPAEVRRAVVGGQRLHHLRLLLDTARRAVELEEDRSEEHTSELQSLMRISYAVFCLKKKT